MAERTGIDTLLDMTLFLGGATMLTGIVLKASGHKDQGDKVTMVGGATLASTLLVSAWRRFSPDVRAIMADPAAKELTSSPSDAQELAERQAFIRAHRALWADPTFQKNFHNDAPTTSPSSAFTQVAQEERFVRIWDHGPDDERLHIVDTHRQMLKPSLSASLGFSDNARAQFQAMSELMAKQALRKAKDPVAVRAKLDEIWARWA